MQTATISPISNSHPNSHSGPQSFPQPAIRPEAAEAERLGNQITELCSYLYAAEARLLKLIREFDDKQGWAEQGFHSCAHWLNFKCGIGMNAAREKVRVARALVDLPKMESRLASGELSYSKVRAMTRIANADNEDALLNVAKHGQSARDGDGKGLCCRSLPGRRARYRGNIPADLLPQHRYKDARGRERRTAFDRAPIPVDSTGHPPGVTHQGRRLSLPGLHPHPLCRWTPHKSLGRWR